MLTMLFYAEFQGYGWCIIAVLQAIPARVLENFRCCRGFVVKKSYLCKILGI